MELTFQKTIYKRVNSGGGLSSACKLRKIEGAETRKEKRLSVVKSLTTFI